MKTSAIISTPKPAPLKYPYLGIYKQDRSFIVFFTKQDNGVVVHKVLAGSAWSLGFTPSDLGGTWTESLFEPLPPGSTVTLIQE